MMKGTRRMKTFPKLVAVLLLLILPICAMGVIGNRNEQRVIQQTFMDSMQSKLHFYMESMETEIRRFLDLLYYYTNNDYDFQRIATIYEYYSDYERSEAIIDVRRKLGQIYATSQYIDNVYLYLPSQNKSINAKTYDYELDIQAVRDLQKIPLFSGSLHAYRDALVLYSLYPENTSRLPIMLMRIDIDQQVIAQTLAGIERMEGSGAVLVGEQWGIGTKGTLRQTQLDLFQTVFSDAGAKADDGLFVMDEEKYLLVSQYSKLLNATMAIYIPQQTVLEMLRSSQDWVYILSAMTVILVLGATYITYRVAHVPIRRMVAAFTKVEQGDRHIRLERKSNDEFFYLYTQFNKMMDTLEQLFKKSYEQEIRWQQAQYKQLQAQINPHFFYNTFFVLQGMIYMDDKETALKMLKNLGSYFQFITRSGSEHIPLDREVAHAVAYCEIQMVRFENIKVQVDPIPQGYEDMQVPRLILQPILENAFIHGLENKVRDGFISIRWIDTDKYLIIEISDNGEYLSEGMLIDLKQKLAQDDHEPVETTAMLNIHRRLRYYYGDEAGLHIARNMPTGLCVKMYLKKTGEEGKHA